jgi:hypothetical protein
MHSDRLQPPTPSFSSSRRSPAKAVSRWRRGVILPCVLTLFLMFGVVAVLFTMLEFMHSTATFAHHHPLLAGGVIVHGSHATETDRVIHAAPDRSGGNANVDANAADTSGSVPKRLYHMSAGERRQTLDSWMQSRHGRVNKQKHQAASKASAGPLAGHPVNVSLPRRVTPPPSPPPTPAPPSPKPTRPPPLLPPMPGRSFTDRSSDYAHDLAALRRYRRGVVIDEIEYSFAGYAKCAWGWDEVRPVSCTGRNWDDMGGYPSPGLALTLIDSLTTLYLANLTEHWRVALEYVERELTFDVPVSVSVFEMTIRVVGGLLSAYELSGEAHPFLLQKARDMADRLLPAFNTQTGFPNSHIHLRLGNHSNAPWHPNSVYLAEIASFGIEFRSLSYHTRDGKYAKAVSRVNNAMMTFCSETGLCQLRFDVQSLHWDGQEYSIGGLADSYYEYLLKLYIHSGFEDLPSLSRFLRASASIIQELVIFDVKANESNKIDVISSAAQKFVYHARPTSALKQTTAATQAAGPVMNGNGSAVTATVPPTPPPVPRTKRSVHSAFVTAGRDGTTVYDMDHLVCFAAGMFELGYHATPWDDPGFQMLMAQRDLPADLREKLRDASLGIGQTCRDVSTMTNFGLPPEVSTLNGDRHSDFAAHLSVHHLKQPYLLRPEALESFFYLTLFDLHPALSGPGASIHTATSLRHRSRWEDAAWDAFVQVIRHCKVANGYSGVLNVMMPADVEKYANDAPSAPNSADAADDLDGRAPRHNDLMESFWLAESLKYLLLTNSIDEHSFGGESDRDASALGDLLHRHARNDRAAQTGSRVTSASVARGVTWEWVLNTEAHPLRVRPDLFDRIPPL